MKDLIIDMVVRQARAHLLSGLPSIIGGPLASVLTIFLEKVVRVLVEKTALGLNFLYVDIRTEAELIEYNRRMEEVEDAIFEGAVSEEALDQMVMDLARKYYRIGSLCIEGTELQDVQEAPLR